jgi:hypothetical protein
MLNLRVSIKRIDVYCPTLINKTCHLCDSEIFFTAFVGVIKFIEILNGDDKLQAYNATDNWCLVLTTQFHIIRLSYQISFEATYF